MTFQRSIIVALAVVMTAGQVMAQAPKQQQQGGALPMPSDPAQTTASYGDWVLRCVRTGDKGAGPRVCELVQTMVLQGQQQPVAQVAVGYDKNELRITLLVPPAVSFSRAPTLSVPGASGAALRPGVASLPAQRLLRRHRGRGRAAQAAAQPRRADADHLQGCRRARRLAALLDARPGPGARRARQGASLEPMSLQVPPLRVARGRCRVLRGRRGHEQRDRCPRPLRRGLPRHLPRYARRGILSSNSTNRIPCQLFASLGHLAGCAGRAPASPRR